MRKLQLLAMVALLLCAGVARAASIGVGVFGGASAPVLQDDEGQGTLYGLRAPVKLVPLIAVEPYYLSSSLGDKSITVGSTTLTRDGSDVTGYGLNAMLTMGGPIAFYPFAGLGQAKFKRTGQDQQFTTYQAGFGLGLSPVPKLSLDLRGEVQAAVDKDVSRKLINITAGVSYALFSLP